jgi:hypothetical protein
LVLLFVGSFGNHIWVSWWLGALPPGP